MRTIKFRGLDSEHKFIYGFLMCNYSPYEKENVICDSFIYRGLRNIECPIPVVGSSVGQFTGLLDKNGVEIYEGDIFDYGIHRRFSCFYDCSRGWYVAQFADGTTNSMVPIEKFEIIGNIHENPELLK